MEGFWNNTYVWIGVAFLVIFFGVRVGKSVAKSMARRKIAADPLSSAELKIAQNLELSGEFEAAARAYQQLVDRFPDSETGYLYLGYLQKKRKDFPAAAEAFRGALRVNPDSVDALVEVGNALWAAGDVPSAESAYREVLLKDEANADAHAALGAILDETGRGAQAVGHLERFIAIAGEKPTKRRTSMLVEAKGRLERLKGGA